jgi:hypothetical protein
VAGEAGRAGPDHRSLEARGGLGNGAQVVLLLGVAHDRLHVAGGDLRERARERLGAAAHLVELERGGMDARQAQHGDGIGGARRAGAPPHLGLRQRDALHENLTVSRRAARARKRRREDDERPHEPPGVGARRERRRDLRADMSAERRVELLVDGARARPVRPRQRRAHSLGGRVRGHAAGVGVDCHDARRRGRRRVADRNEAGEARRREGDAAVGGAGEVVGDDHDVEHGYLVPAERAAIFAEESVLIMAPVSSGTTIIPPGTRSIERLIVRWRMAAPPPSRYASPPRPSPCDDPRLRGARLLAKLLDGALGVPGTRLRVGLDPILGLIPGIGDALGALASSYLVLVAVQLGAPASVVGRLVLNIAVDTIVGAVPVLGDVFDFGFRSNARNLALLEEWLARPGPTRRASGAIVAVAVVVTLLVIVAVALAAWKVLAWATRYVSGG